MRIILRAKILEYKLINSLNSSESCYEEVPVNFDEDILKQKKSFQDFLSNLDNLEFKLPSREFKNYLNEKWSDSLSNIRKNVQKGAYSSIEEVQLRLAALIFNMNINLSPDDTEDRSKLLEAFNYVYQIM